MLRLQHVAFLWFDLDSIFFFFFLKQPTQLIGNICLAQGNPLQFGDAEGGCINEGWTFSQHFQRHWPGPSKQRGPPSPSNKTACLGETLRKLFCSRWALHCYRTMVIQLCWDNQKAARWHLPFNQERARLSQLISKIIGSRSLTDFFFFKCIISSHSSVFVLIPALTHDSFCAAVEFPPCLSPDLKSCSTLKGRFTVYWSHPAQTGNRISLIWSHGVCKRKQLISNCSLRLSKNMGFATSSYKP